MARTDPHRPSAICPADYDYEFSFSLATMCDGWPVPAINIELIVELRRNQKPGAIFSPIHSATNACDVCGAWFIHGDVWRHRPSGEYITLGHICAHKYSFYADRSGWEALRGSAIAKAERRARKLDAIRGCRVLFADEPDLRIAFRTRHHIIDDIKARLIQWGSLTPKQIALVKKIHQDEVRRATEVEFTPADAPEGRQVIEATVLGTKVQEGDYGTTLKMLVRVEVGDGTAWKAWGTVPQGLFDQIDAKNDELFAEYEKVRDGFFAKWVADVEAGTVNPNDVPAAPAAPERPPLRGCKVRFTGTLQRSDRDRDFAFFKRPSKAEILEFA